MKRNSLSRVLAVALTLTMCLALFAACATQPAKDDSTSTSTASSSATSTASSSASSSDSAEPEKTNDNETPLVVGYLPFSEKFSPFFADTAYDQDAMGMTQISLLTTDRAGAIVYNAIEGEKHEYNGTEYTYTGPANLAVNYDEATDQTTYNWKIRDDMKFSDGEPVTADDIIFTYYVFCDPSYAGSVTLNSLPIVGLKNYRTQTSDAVYEKYNKLFDDIYAAGEAHEWSESDGWTKELQDSFWATIKAEWIRDTQAITALCVAQYSNEGADALGVKAEEIPITDGLQVAVGMVMWGYGTVGEDGLLTGAKTGKTWDIKGGVYPTDEDYYAECYKAYNGDPDAYWTTEKADADSVLDAARASFISTEGSKDDSLAGAGIPNIEGIKKISDTEVSVTIKGIDAAAVYQLGVSIAPMHYYGDKTKYDYENNKFGLDYGDLLGVQAKTTKPMGAGAYKLMKYENKIIYFEANESYFKGAPKTKYVQFKETADADKVSGVKTGTIDVADPSFSKEAISEIISYNSNGEITGDTIETTTVNFLGYGYIGINADTVKVGDNPSSEESKNLRRALATIISVYRDLSIDSYYGDRAAVINYPISNTSWAAPQSTDDGYKVAYSTKLDGTPIYTSEMSSEDKYTAAMAAAVEYLKAAGFTFDDASGKFTAAPKGAKLEYELIVPADGKGDHPVFMLTTKVKEAFATIGMNIIVNDPTDSNVLWDKMDANAHEIWAAAWGATIDPDMYQTYHSSGIMGRGGSDSNHYHIDDPQLDQLLLDGRKSLDQSYRKATYKACLDTIMNWAVEIPTYQRQDCTIFSAERVNLDTITPDITTFWKWLSEIEKVEMNPAAK